MSHIATHIRIFAADPSDDLVEKRTDAIGEITKIFQGYQDVGELLKTANDLAVAVEQGGKLSATLTATIEEAIRKKSTAFVADKHELEMLACGLSGALHAVMGGAALRHGVLSICDALSFGLWSALSFQKPRAEQKIEQLRDELLHASQAHCVAVAYDSRERIAIPDPEFKETPEAEEGEPETPFNTSMNEGLKPFKDAIADLRSNAAVDREEIDLLWWVLSDWSSLLGRRFSDEKSKGVAAAVASGLEAGRMIRRAPAAAHRHLVLRYVRAGKDLSLQELLTEIGTDRAALAPTEGQTYISENPAVFPLSTALQTGVASEPRAKIKRSLSEWAERALLESSIARLCSHAAGVSV